MRIVLTDLARKSKSNEQKVFKVEIRVKKVFLVWNELDTNEKNWNLSQKLFAAVAQIFLQWFRFDVISLLRFFYFSVIEDKKFCSYFSLFYTNDKITKCTKKIKPSLELIELGSAA